MRAIWALLALPVIGALLIGSGVRGSAEIVGYGVEMSPRSWRAGLDLLCSGREIRVATLRADAPVAVQFFVIAQGDARVAGGLTARLAGPREYVVHMPCAISTSECARVMAVMPGYDAPMEIAPGVYDLYIKGGCEVEKSGELTVVVELKASGSAP